MLEQASPVTGSDGDHRTHLRDESRPLMTLFGPVHVERISVGARGSDSLFPLGAELNLPPEEHSFGVRRRIAIEASKGSFDEAVEAVTTQTGFAATFHRQVSPDEERALDLLVKTIPAALPDTARGMATDRAPELTWQVASKAPAASIREDLELYLELKKIKGATEATKWFTTRQDQAMVGILTARPMCRGRTS